MRMNRFWAHIRWSRRCNVPCGVFRGGQHPCSKRDVPLPDAACSPSPLTPRVRGIKGGGRGGKGEREYRASQRLKHRIRPNVLSAPELRLAGCRRRMIDDRSAQCTPTPRTGAGLARRSAARRAGTGRGVWRRGAAAADHDGVPACPDQGPGRLASPSPRPAHPRYPRPSSALYLLYSGAGRRAWQRLAHRTESGMYDAMQQARAKYLVERPPSGIVEFDIGYVVAEGYYKGGVIEGTTSTVRAFFDNQGRLVSVFGLLPS